MKSPSTLLQGKASYFLPVMFFVIISLIFCRNIFININNWGILDWDQHFLYHAVPYRTITEYHEFPLWNPYYCGGNVLLANPQTRFLSPVFLFELVFGVVIGLKLEIWFHLVIGMYGMFLIPSKLYNFSRISSLIPPVVYMLSGMYAFNLAAGQTNFMCVAYMPYVFYFFVKGIKEVRYSILSGCFLALMVLEGGTYIVPHTALFISIYGILTSIQKKSLQPLRAVIISGVTGCSLSAVKLLPSLEFMQRVPRHTDSTDSLTLELFYQSILSRTQDLWIKGLPGQVWGWEEYAHYIGLVPLLLALAGIVMSFKKEWPLFFTGIVFLILAWGNFSYLSPWNVLHHLPLFNSQRVPSRFLQNFIFVVSLFAGFFASWLETRDFKQCSQKAMRVSLLLLLVTITVDLLIVNSSVFSSSFPHKPPHIQKNLHFRQIDGDSTAMYESFLKNYGTINAYEPVHIPINALSLDNTQYRNGEVYFSGDGMATLKKWSPNSVTVNVKGDGFLFLNQNYDPGWRASKNKKVIELQGLVATKVNRDDIDITFYYFPMSLLIGIIITFFSVIASILILKKTGATSAIGVRVQ